MAHRNRIISAALLFSSALLTLANQAPAQQEPKFPKDFTSEFSVEAFEAPALVWVPANYVPNRAFPVVFFYHGTTSRPTVEMIRLVTQSKDWIVVGMSYKGSPTDDYTKELFAEEVAIFQKTYKELSQHLNFDNEKVYVGGFSKGGWMSNYLLQTQTNFAGGLILAGGHLDIPDGKVKPDQQIYIGSGETDNNVATSVRAGRFFEKAGAKVEIEQWLGKGHEYPNVYSDREVEKMRQWLRMRADVATTEEAINWCEQSIRGIKKLEKDNQAAEAFHELIRVSAMPYCDLLDSEAKGALKKLQDKYKNEPAVADEFKAWIEYRKVLTFESRDRYIETLAECVSKYKKVHESYPDTKYGKMASAALQRTQTVLGLQ